MSYRIELVWEYDCDSGREYYGVEIYIDGLDSYIYLDGCGGYDDYSLTYGQILDCGMWSVFFGEETYDEEDYPRDEKASLEEYKFSAEFSAALSDAMDRAKEGLDAEIEKQEYSDAEESEDQENGFALVYSGGAPAVEPEIIGVYRTYEDAEQAYKCRNWWLYDRERANRMGLANTHSFDEIMKITDGELSLLPQDNLPDGN